MTTRGKVGRRELSLLEWARELDDVGRACHSRESGEEFT